MQLPTLLKVLLLEDLISDAELAKRELRKSGMKVDIKHVENQQDYETALLEFKPDIVLSDYSMPQFTGLEALMFKQEHYPDIPLIILTGSMNEETAVECMKSGADDYVIKEHITRLPMAILSALEKNHQRILRQQADKALEKSYQDWMNIFQSISNPAMILSPRHEILEANRTTLEKTGLTIDEIRGKLCHEIFHNSPDKPVAFCPAEKIIRGMDSGVSEEEVEALGGQYLVSCTPVLDENGNLEKIIHISTDITQLNIIKSEQAKLLEERSKLLHRLNLQFETMPSGLITTDAGFNIIDWNPAAEKILGYSKEEVAGQNIIPKIVPPELIQKVLETFNNATLIRENIIGINDNITKSGKRITCEWHDTALFDENGEVFGYMSMFTDISDKIKSEKAKETVYDISELIHTTENLDELYFKIHNIISQLMTAKNFYIALLDNDNQHLTFPYFVDEYDYSPVKKKLGRGLTEYVLRTRKPILANTEMIQELADQGEIELIGKSSVDWLGVPLIINNRIIGVLGVQNYNDSSIYGESEKDLLVFVSEQVAAAIDKKLKEQELIIAKDKAEESSRLKSSLLANLSHELRTPMNGILGFSELLNDHLEDSPFRDMSKNILNSGKRLMNTLESVMTLAELQTDTFVLNIQEIDLKTIIDECFDEYKEAIDSKNLELIFIQDGPIRLFTDHQLLYRALDKIINNAVKFTSAGSVTVKLSMNNHEDDHFVQISLIDTGIGIPKEFHMAVFQEFRQVSEGINRSFEGMGLGLSLATKIIHRLGGTIDLVSEHFKGTEIIITLPVNNSIDSLTALNNDYKDSIKQLISRRQNPPQFLIVEDNQITSNLLNLYIEDFGNCDIVFNGREAIEKIKSKSYDTILLDINLGDEPDGIEIAGLVRSGQMNRNCPIIAVTGYASNEDRQRILNSGFNYYIAKPFYLQQILKTLLDALRQTEGQK